MFHTPAHKSGTAGQVQIAGTLVGHDQFAASNIAVDAKKITTIGDYVRRVEQSERVGNWKIQVYFGGWFDLVPTDGTTNAYESQAAADAAIKDRYSCEAFQVRAVAA